MVQRRTARHDDHTEECLAQDVTGAFSNHLRHKAVVLLTNELVQRPEKESHRLRPRDVKSGQAEY